MADFNFKDLIDAAKEAGFETEQLPAGRYSDAEVTHTNVTSTQGGGLRVGIRFKVHGGPQDGNGVWMNQMVPNKEKAKSPEKFQQAAGIFLRIMSSLGVELSDDLAGSVNAIVGNHYDIDVSYKVNGQYTNTNVAIKGRAGGTAAPVATRVAAAPAPIPASDLDDDLDDRPI